MELIWKSVGYRCCSMLAADPGEVTDWLQQTWRRVGWGWTTMVLSVASTPQ